ncbi:Crp/Fnr family transcriptional regulator [Sphingomonas sanxanigenens]|uniref:Crp/Fnr family transcriptional regulator n=1 Tax=Sphingomonas sanxanigenens TaxID=397260 RepID=UPI0004B9FCAB|nr:Crp/Fnr family transcriptional regulator [Sphingomonas sanxanigenens]
MRSTLSDEERNAILGLPCEFIDVAANHDFIRLGENSRHACLVAEGLVGRFAQTAAGARQIFALHIPGDMADLHSLVAPEASTGLQALSRSTMLAVPHAALLPLLDLYPGIGRAFWRDSIVDTSILSTWVLNLGCRSGGARLAHLLCEMAVRYALIGRGRDLRFDLPATQLHLAECTGMTSVHLNRMMMELRGRGLVRTRTPKIEIIDWKGLTELAGFDAGYLCLPSSAAEQVRLALRVR